MPATPLTTAQLALLKPNMLIDTSHSPKYSAIVQSWTANAITVGGWVQMNNTATGQVPPGTATAYVNPITKIWALNANATLSNYGYATAAAGFELGINNNTGAYNSATDTPTTWGYDVVNLGTNTVSAGFIQRGDMQNGYVARSGRNAAFVYTPTGGYPQLDGFQTQQTTGNGFHVMANMTAGNGFWTQQASGNAMLASDPIHGQKFLISAIDGSMEIGALGQGMGASAAAVANGGSGYAIGDTITLAGGTMLTIATLTGGAVATATVTAPGTWSSFPAGAVAQTATSGGGSGATFTLSFTAGIAASSPVIDFHTTGGPDDYNARITAFGGTLGANGSGTLKHIATTHQVFDPNGAGFSITGGATPTIASTAASFGITATSGAAVNATGVGALTLTAGGSGAVIVNGGIMASTGQIELGGQSGTATAAFVDFHTTGGSEDYNARINATGGTLGTVGSAGLRYVGASHTLLDNAGNSVTLTLGNAPTFASSGTFAVTTPSGAGLSTTAGGSVTIASSSTGSLSLNGSINASAGAIELGGQSGIATSAYVDFHTTGGNEDYNARINATGGTTGTVGSAGLRYVAASHTLLDNAGNSLAVTLGGAPTLASSGSFAITAASGASVIGNASGGVTLTATGSGFVTVNGPIAAGAGQIELGNQTGNAGNSYIDFHTTGGNEDYNARLVATGGTAGSIGSAALQVNAAGFVINSTGYLQFPSGTTAQQPAAPTAGMGRYNSTTSRYEYWVPGSPGVWVNHVRLTGDSMTGALSVPSLASSGAVSGATFTAANTNSAVLSGAASGAVSLSATGANVGIALVTSGTGALSAAVPNSAQSGGNNRGTNATDWQQTRTQATQVASGVNATIVGGGNNTASGNNTTVGGNSNSVSGNNGVAFGNGNQISGSFSAAPGGYQASDGGLYGKFAFASGMFARQGDAQTALYVLRGATTGTTAVRLSSDGNAAGTANTLNLPNKGAYGFGRIVVLAFDNSGFNAAMWHVDGLLVTRGGGAGSTTIVGTPTVTLVQASAALSSLSAGSLAVSADTANGGINFTVTGTATALHMVARAATAEAA